MEQTNELNLFDVFRIIKNHLILIIALLLIGGAAAYTYTYYCVDPLYVARSQYNVLDTTDGRYSEDTDFTYIQRMAKTYTYFYKTSSFLDDVAATSNLGYSGGQLSNMVSVAVIDDTEMFSVTVTTKNPQHSIQIQDTIAELTPNMISTYTDDKGKVNLLDKSKNAAKVYNINKNTATGAALGAALGIGIAFLHAILDKRVKSRDDLSEKYSGVPILAEIPEFGNGKKSGKKGNKADGRLMQEVLNEKTPFSVKESFKTLRTNLQFTVEGSNCQVLIVSSAVPMEGKSTTCINLAVTIAQTGLKVLVVDGDLRKGLIHKFFGIDNSVGLSNVISGMSAIDEGIFQTPVDSLSIMPTGIKPPNPAELIGSGRMEVLLNKLRENFDCIIIDTPPVNVVSDALPLTKIVNGVLLVVRQNQTSYDEIDTALKHYDLAGSNVLGFVLNATEQEEQSGYKYKYKYKYYYDEY